MIKLIIIFFCLVKISFTNNIIEVKKAYENKQFQAVISLFDKYPSLFVNINELAMLARSYYAIQDYPLASKNCHLALELGELAWCNSMLKVLKTKKPNDYKLGYAFYLDTIGNANQSVELLTNIILNSKELQARATEYLLPLYRKNGSYYQINEHLSDNESYTPVIKAMKQQLERYKTGMQKHFKNNEPQLPKDKNIALMWFMTAHNNSYPEIADSLLKEEQAKINDLGFTEDSLIKIAYLLLTLERYEELNALLESSQNSIGTSIAKFSFNYIQKKVNEKLKLKEIKSKPTKTVIAEVKKDYLNSQIAIASLPVNTDEDIKPLNLTPLDTSSLKLASEGDLSPYHNLYAEFLGRNEVASDYEKRFLYKQIDELYDDLIDNEKTSPALMAYLNTKEGKEFQAKADELAKSFEETDLKNAKQFNGELEKFNKDLNFAQNKKDKLVILSNYTAKWENLVFGEHTNLLVQGAATKFRETKEGKALAKRVYELVTELNLFPDLDTTSPEFLEERDWD